MARREPSNTYANYHVGSVGHRDILLKREARVAELRANGTPTPDYVEALIDLAEITIGLDYTKAEAILREASTFAELLDYREGLIVILIRLAWSLVRRGKTDAALIDAARARYLAQTLKADAMACAANCVIASAHRAIGELAVAESMQRELIAEARRIGDRELEADYLSELAITCQQKGDTAETLALRLQAHAIYSEYNDGNTALSCNNIAWACLHAGKLLEAQTWVDAARLACPAEARSLQCDIQHTQAVLHIRRGELPEARAALDAVLSVCASITGDLRFQSIALLDRSQVFGRLGDTGRAIEDAEAACSLAKSGGASQQLECAQRALIALYTRIGALGMAARIEHNRRMSTIDAKLRFNEQRDAFSAALASLEVLEQTWREMATAA